MLPPVDQHNCALQMMDDFQSSTTEVEATIQTAAVVLCNDKPQTFGAPDVLQITASRASAHYTTTMFFPDRPPNQASFVHCCSGMPFKPPVSQTALTTLCL